MNLRRGLFRVWIAATFLWLAAYALYFWSTCFYSADDTLMCWIGDEDWTRPISGFSIRDYVRLSMIGLSVPLGTLLVGYVCKWVARG
jgi:hypothetical protein